MIIKIITPSKSELGRFIKSMSGYLYLLLLFSKQVTKLGVFEKQNKEKREYNLYYRKVENLYTENCYYEKKVPS